MRLTRVIFICHLVIFVGCSVDTDGYHFVSSDDTATGTAFEDASVTDGDSSAATDTPQMDSSTDSGSDSNAGSDSTYMDSDTGSVAGGRDSVDDDDAHSNGDTGTNADVSDGDSGGVADADSDRDTDSESDVDSDTDSTATSLVCTAPFIYQAGACVLVCNDGQIKCNDTCITPETNQDYCGASSTCEGLFSGEACANDETCEMGVCRLQCSGNLVPCDGGCIDPSTDENHCGARNHCEGSDSGDVCGSGGQCLAGTCRLPNGADCNAGVECNSGICSTFYLDADGDGYGAASSGQAQVCGNQPPGADYVTNDFDCCDAGIESEQANPDFINTEVGQIGRSDSIPGCINPFDWNCDGVETKEFLGGGCTQHTTESECDGTYDGESPACGDPAPFSECIWTSSGDCTSGPGGLLVQRCY